MNSSWLFYDFFRPFPVPSGLGAQNEMALALERVLTPAAGEAEPKLNISVVFTSVESTLAALRKAGVLANRMNARVTLVVPQVVPYPLPLTSPPVLVDWSERRFRIIANGSPVETTVRLYLCRDRVEMLTTVLSPRSLVVLGSRKRRWWPTSEKRLARKLRGAGREVLLMETE
jgi:hypothetical protein